MERESLVSWIAGGSLFVKTRNNIYGFSIKSVKYYYLQQN